jgi:hypothetical protein
VTDVPPTTRLVLCLEDILRGRVPLFDGLDALVRLTREAPHLAGDRDLERLAAMLDEVEHLPVGAARAHWSAEALARHDRTLMEIEARSRDQAFYACRRLQERLTREA